jgi:hypothetical protein
MTRPNETVHSELSQDERRDLLQNDRDLLPKTTLSTFAEAFADEERGGRFKTEQPTHVIGSTPIPKYPELPASSPSHHDVVPDEPPLGFSVEQLEPLGTEAEIEASINKLTKPEVDGAT